MILDLSFTPQNPLMPLRFLKILSKTALILAFDANLASLPNLRSFIESLRALWVVPRVYS